MAELFNNLGDFIVKWPVSLLGPGVSVVECLARGSHCHELAARIWRMLSEGGGTFITLSGLHGR